VVLAGDLGDFYSKSRFRKTRYVSYDTELKAVFSRMEWLSRHFKQTHVMLGNHDNRPEKMLQDILTTHGQADMLAFTELNLIKRMASYFPNVTVVGQRVNGVVVNFIYQHKDVVFTHAEISSAQESAVLSRISNYLHRWRKTLRLKPFKAILQAHNHVEMKMSKGGEHWFLIPTASSILEDGFEYMLERNTKLVGNPPQTGYTVLYFGKSGLDYNRSYNQLIEIPQ